MPPAKFIKRPSDLYQYPDIREVKQGKIVCSDLHGNALKWVHFLITHGIVDFKAGIDKNEAYQKFTKLYDAAGDLAKNYVKLQNDLVEIKMDRKRLAEKNKHKQQAVRILGGASSPSNGAERAGH